MKQSIQQYVWNALKKSEIIKISKYTSMHATILSNWVRFKNIPLFGRLTKELQPIDSILYLYYNSPDEFEWGKWKKFIDSQRRMAKALADCVCLAYCIVCGYWPLLSTASRRLCDYLIYWLRIWFFGFSVILHIILRLRRVDWRQWLFSLSLFFALDLILHNRIVAGTGEKIMLNIIFWLIRNWCYFKLFFRKI